MDTKDELIAEAAVLLKAQHKGAEKWLKKHENYEWREKQINEWELICCDKPFMVLIPPGGTQDPYCLNCKQRAKYIGD
jgi:hypothetical protein